MKNGFTPKPGDIIVYKDENENKKPYLKVAARMPGFLKEFPPHKGYAILIEPTDLFGMTAARSVVLQEYMRNGQMAQEPTDFVTTKLTNAAWVLFTGKMISPEGKIMAMASSMVVVTGEKQFEAGETACINRLMMVLGHGSEDYLYDEPSQTDVDAKKEKGAKPETAPLPVAIAEPAAQGLDGTDETGTSAWQSLANQIRNIQRTRGITGDIPPTVVGARKMFKEMLKDKKSQVTSESI